MPVTERAADDATSSVCPPSHQMTYTVHVKGSRQARRKLQEAGIATEGMVEVVVIHGWVVKVVESTMCQCVI
ncbi:hypothetical protein Pmani_026152 [Petrolisthes manimaculis]|uniref:Uncharacterized protein n=1 Tax=Petrolisthes manimaculis TaxID=1843537 RepID=A0AAE1P6N5_9EUCA|nr:hypothetical protein Pmani_026152 [Petrolisthes manimaculis]